MNACQLVTFISAIACQIANCSSTEELEIKAAVFCQLGDTLATIAVQRSICESNDETTLQASEAGPAPDILAQAQADIAMVTDSISKNLR